MLEKTIVLRVDVDTSRGLKKGVPKLLDLFKRCSVRVTFFVVAGPDSMGQHMFRFRHKGYWRRILGANPFKMIASYGIAPFFYGTLIRRPPHVAGSAPDVMKRILDEGHEIGLHGYDHAGWADHFLEWTPEKIRSEMDQASEVYRKLLGTVPVISACPNWRCTDDILLELDKLGFLCFSDTRGEAPFFPRTKYGVLKTLQIPQTMPTFHECFQAGICSKRHAVSYLVKNELRERTLNVFTIHDWLEGMSETALAEQFIRSVLREGYQFKTLSVCAKEVLTRRQEIPICTIGLKPVTGGIGQVACQERNG